MYPKTLSLAALALSVGWMLVSCSSAGQAVSAESSTPSSYYGTLPPVQKLKSFRNLKGTLEDKSMTDVSRLLGSPAQVKSFGDSESWRYSNLAYDSTTHRVVRDMTVWFENGKVDDIRASF
jgi:hypothetical protein